MSNQTEQTEQTVAELTTPPAAPERDVISGKPKPQPRAARVTGGAKPLQLTSRAKMGKARTAQRGGKAIGNGAVKRKAQQESTKPVARPKAAQNGFTADARIKPLKSLAERAKDPKAQPGSERHNTFKIYLSKKGLTVAEFVKAGGKLTNLQRDVKFKHVVVR